jgi:hypothetical protein
MAVPISFLTIDDTYIADLPDELAPDPDATAAWNYQGDRYITFTPGVRFDPSKALDQFDLSFEVERDGIQVAVYSRTYDPPLLSAYWKLENGYLGTFVADPLPTTPEAMATVINAITVESLVNRPVPRVTFASPLSRSGTDGLELRNSLNFVPTGDSRSWPYVQFVETPDASGATSGVSTHSNSVSAWAVAAPGLVVVCSGPTDDKDELVDISKQIAASVEPTSPRS